jgi:hypothetical protein
VLIELLINPKNYSNVIFCHKNMAIKISASIFFDRDLPEFVILFNEIFFLKQVLKLYKKKATA